MLRLDDPARHIHVTERGDPKFVGFAWAVSDRDELKKVSKLLGASGIDSIDEPGGGKRVRLTEPNCYTIEIVRHRTCSAEPCRAPATQLWG